MDPLTNAVPSVVFLIAGVAAMGLMYYLRGRSH